MGAVGSAMRHLRRRGGAVLCLIIAILGASAVPEPPKETSKNDAPVTSPGAGPEAKKGTTLEDARAEALAAAERDGKTEMEMIDSNKDGKASLEELEAFMKMRYYESDMMKGDEAKLAEQIKSDATEMMKELDVDSSGDLNLEEVIAQYKDEAEEDHDEEVEDEEDNWADEEEGNNVAE